MPLTRRHLLQRLAVGALACGHALPLLASERQPRVIALNWAAAETLLALDTPPLAISDGQYYDRRMPLQLPGSVRDVGPYWEPNLEMIQQLRPELILADPLPPAIKRALDGIAPTRVVDIYPATESVWTRSVAFTRQLAAQLELAERGEAYIQHAEARFEALARQLARQPQPPICVAVLNQDGRHATVYGRHSMVEAVLARLGLRNAWQGPSNAMGSSVVGIERLADDPEAHLLYVEIPTTAARLQSLRQRNALWENLPAVRHGRVLDLGKFFSYGAAASCLDLAERIAAHLLYGDTAHV